MGFTFILKVSREIQKLSICQLKRIQKLVSRTFLLFSKLVQKICESCKSTNYMRKKYGGGNQQAVTPKRKQIIKCSYNYVIHFRKKNNQKLKQQDETFRNSECQSSREKLKRVTFFPSPLIIHVTFLVKPIEHISV